MIKPNIKPETDEEQIKDPFSAETVQTPPVEQAEAIATREKDRMRQEVLKQVSESEQPMRKPAPAPEPAVTTPVLPEKSESLVIIEDILAEDLQDVYFKMDPSIQKKFKDEGERTAGKIESLLKETKDQTQKIFQLIYNWLKMIPGVKNYFLNQEAKIKADKIIKIKK